MFYIGAPHCSRLKRLVGFLYPLTAHHYYNHLSNLEFDWFWRNWPKSFPNKFVDVLYRQEEQRQASHGSDNFFNTLVKFNNQTMSQDKRPRKPASSPFLKRFAKGNKKSNQTVFWTTGNRNHDSQYDLTDSHYISLSCLKVSYPRSIGAFVWYLGPLISFVENFNFSLSPSSSITPVACVSPDIGKEVKAETSSRVSSNSPKQRWLCDFLCSMEKSRTLSHYASC